MVTARRDYLGLPDGVADAVVRLGRIVLNFGLVERKTYHPDGKTLETDTTHTVMLGTVGCALARDYFPQLNPGLIAQYALVHDLPEVYAGDTPTLRELSADAKAEKALREQAAADRIRDEVGDDLPWVPDMIAEYEARTTPEARFVKALDKLLPKITHISNDVLTVRQEGMDAEALAARYVAQRAELMQYASDFPQLLDLHAELVSLVLSLMPAAQK